MAMEQTLQKKKIHTYIHTVTYIQLHTYIHTCIHTYVHTYINTYIHTLSILWVRNAYTVTCSMPPCHMLKSRAGGRLFHINLWIRAIGTQGVATEDRTWAIIYKSRALYLESWRTKRSNNCCASSFWFTGVSLSPQVSLTFYGLLFGLVNTYTTYIHTYIHTHIHTYIHTHIHPYMHTCVHTHTHIQLLTYIPTYIPTHIPTYIPTYIHTVHICGQCFTLC